MLRCEQGAGMSAEQWMIGIAFLALVIGIGVAITRWDRLR